MYRKNIAHDRGLQPSLGMPSSSPILTVLPVQARSRRPHRFHPFYKQPPSYRPYLNVCTNERHTPSPPITQTSTNVSSLYPEILGIIFSHLEVRDKGVAARVCRAWREASYYKSVWKGAEAKLHVHGPNPTLVNSFTRRGIKRIQILSLCKSFREIAQGIGNLTSLNLSGCYNVRDDNLHHAFSRAIPTLLHLDLSQCKQITDKSVFRIVQSLSNLESLELGGCSNVTDEGLMAISNGLRRLKSLNLRSCWSVSDQGVRLLAGQSDKCEGNLVLERLSFQDCQHLSDEALKFISTGLRKVQYVNLSFCINISDVGLKYLAKMSSLREVDLHSCDNVSDVGLAFMAEATSPITTLDISFCDKMGDQSLEYISQGLFQLKCLSLRTCRITDGGLSKLAKALSDLEVLNVGQCIQITASSLYTITDSLKNLRCVDLYGCKEVDAVAIADLNAKFFPRCVFNITLCNVKKS